MSEILSSVNIVSGLVVFFVAGAIIAMGSFCWMVCQAAKDDIKRTWRTK